MSKQDRSGALQVRKHNRGPSNVTSSPFKAKDVAALSDFCVKWGANGTMVEHPEHGQLYELNFTHPAGTLDELEESGFIDGLAQHVDSEWAVSVHLKTDAGGWQDPNAIVAGGNGNRARVLLWILLEARERLEGLGRYLPPREFSQQESGSDPEPSS